VALRAQFEIYHDKPELLAALERAYPSVPDALATSPFFTTNPARNRVVATATRDVVVICVPASDDQLDLIVETGDTDIRQAAQNTWRTIRRAGHKHPLGVSLLCSTNNDNSVAWGVVQPGPDDLQHADRHGHGDVVQFSFTATVVRKP
jgi:hypothetical protein